MTDSGNSMRDHFLTTIPNQTLSLYEQLETNVSWYQIKYVNVLIIFPPYNFLHLLSNGSGNSIMTAKQGGISLVFLSLCFVTSD